MIRGGDPRVRADPVSAPPGPAIGRQRPGIGCPASMPSSSDCESGAASARGGSTTVGKARNATWSPVSWRSTIDPANQSRRLITGQPPGPGDQSTPANLSISSSVSPPKRRARDPSQPLRRRWITSVSAPSGDPVGVVQLRQPDPRNAADRCCALRGERHEATRPLAAADRRHDVRGNLDPRQDRLKGLRIRARARHRPRSLRLAREIERPHADLELAPRPGLRFQSCVRQHRLRAGVQRVRRQSRARRCRPRLERDGPQV